MIDKAIKGKTSKQKIKEVEAKALLLEQALDSFNVNAKVVNVARGPSVTRYELQPGEGIKISKINRKSFANINNIYNFLKK